MSPRLSGVLAGSIVAKRRRKVNEKFSAYAKERHRSRCLSLRCLSHSRQLVVALLQKPCIVDDGAGMGPLPDQAVLIGGGGRYDEMIGKFTGNDTCACGFSIGFERIVMLLLERDFKVPSSSKKKAYLIDKKATPKLMKKVISQANEERKNGYKISINVMKKNKKFQKELLAKDGYEEIREFFAD